MCVLELMGQLSRCVPVRPDLRGDNCDSRAELMQLLSDDAWLVPEARNPKETKPDMVAQ